jgi:hypothetical protein
MHETLTNGQTVYKIVEFRCLLEEIIAVLKFLRVMARPELQKITSRTQ